MLDGYIRSFSAADDGKNGSFEILVIGMWSPLARKAEVNALERTTLQDAADPMQAIRTCYVHFYKEPMVQMLHLERTSAL